MSRARRQQRKRGRRWALEVRDTAFGWRASWWFKGRERFAVKCHSRVERRFTRLMFGEEIFSHRSGWTKYPPGHLFTTRRQG